MGGNKIPFPLILFPFSRVGESRQCSILAAKGFHGLEAPQTSRGSPKIPLAGSGDVKESYGRGRRGHVRGRSWGKDISSLAGNQFGGLAKAGEKDQ